MKTPCLHYALHLAAGALCASLLAGCVIILPRPQPAPAAQADVVLATERGMRSIVFDARGSYLSLSNTSTARTEVLRTGAIVNRASLWTPLELAACGLGPARAGAPLRSPALARLDGKIYLYQPTFGSANQHSLCHRHAAGVAQPPGARAGGWLRQGQRQALPGRIGQRRGALDRPQRQPAGLPASRRPGPGYVADAGPVGTNIPDTKP